MKKFSVLLSILLLSGNLYPVGNLYVQSPNAKLLQEPQASSPGEPLPIGDTLNPVSEQGLFIQVRKGTKTGWVNKLFLSAFPPGGQIKLNSQNEVSDSVQARQRASDFTKTAAARGLTETESLRVRGGGHTYDFDSLLWLETNSVPPDPSPSPGKGTIFERQKDSGKVPGSTEQEVKVGRSIAAKLLHKYGVVKDRDAVLALNEMGRRLASATSRADLTFLFGILDTEEINAFACPGGIILITKGVLRTVQDSSELGGILAHEISHVALKHSGEFQAMNPFIEFLFGLLSPAGGQVVNSATSLAVEEMERQFLETGRNQNTELEADEAGVYLAAMMGYNTSKYGQYLERVSKSPEAKTQSKTHPDIAVRTQKIQKISSSMKPESTAPAIEMGVFKKVLQ